MGTLSQLAAAIAGVAQSAFIARGATMSAWLVWIWAVVGLVFFADAVTNSTWTKDKWSSRQKVCAIALASVVAISVVAWQFYIPGITVDIGKTRPFVVRDKQGRPWIRVVAHNGTSHEAQCKAFLVQLTKTPKQEPIIKADHLLLYPSNGGDGDIYHPILISSDSERMFDVAYVDDKEKNEMNIPSSQTTIDYEVLSPGMYRFKIEISGTGCGTNFKEFTIKYDGGDKLSVAADN